MSFYFPDEKITTPKQLTPTVGKGPSGPVNKTSSSTSVKATASMKSSSKSAVKSSKIPKEKQTNLELQGKTSKLVDAAGGGSKFKESIRQGMEKLKGLINKLGVQKVSFGDNDAFVINSGKNSFYIQDMDAYNQQGGVSISLGHNDGALFINGQPAENLGENTLKAADNLVQLMQKKIKDQGSVPEQKIQAAHSSLKSSFVEKPKLGDNDRCVLIQGISNPAVSRDYRSNYEEKVLNCLNQLDQPGIPYSTLETPEGKKFFVKMAIKDHSSSQYYLQIDEKTGEKNLVQYSLRGQTETDEGALNKKLGQYLKSNSVQQSLLTKNDSGDKVTINRTTNASSFTVNNLLSKTPSVPVSTPTVDASKVTPPKGAINEQDICIFIEGGSSVENRHRTQNEEAIYQALQQLDTGKPFASVKSGDNLYHYVKVDYGERPYPNSKYYLQIDSQTGETKMIQQSLRGQTKDANNLNQKLARIKEHASTTLVSKSTSDQGDTVITEKRVNASEFQLTNLPTLQNELKRGMGKLKELGNQNITLGDNAKAFTIGQGKSFFYLQDAVAYQYMGEAGVSLSLKNDTGDLYINGQPAAGFGEKTLSAANQLVQLIHARAQDPSSVSEERIQAAHLAVKLSCSRLSDGKTEDFGHQIQSGGENRTLAISNLTDALIKYASTGNADARINVLYRSGQGGGELPGDVKGTFMRALTEGGEILENIKYLKPKNTLPEKMLQKDLEEIVQFLTKIPETPFKPMAKPISTTPQAPTPSDLFFKPPAFQEFQSINAISNKIEYGDIKITKAGNNTLINGVPYEKCSVHEQKAAYQVILLLQNHPIPQEKFDAASNALSLAIAMRSVPGEKMKDSLHEVSNAYRALMQFAINENLEEVIDVASKEGVQKIKIKDLFSRIAQEGSGNLPPALSAPIQKVIVFAENAPKIADQKFFHQLGKMTFEDAWNLGRSEQTELNPMRDQLAAKLNEFNNSKFFNSDNLSSSTLNKNELIIGCSTKTVANEFKNRGLSIGFTMDQRPALLISPNNWDKFKEILTSQAAQKIFTQAEAHLQDSPSYYQSKDGNYTFGKTVKNEQPIIYIKDQLAERNQQGGTAISFNMTTQEFWKNGKKETPNQADLQILQKYLDPDAIKNSKLL